jgi:hypothetical protein
VSNGVKYLLAGIAVVAMGFVTMGILHPKVACTSHIEINASSALVFQSVKDTSLMKFWIHGLQSVSAEKNNKESNKLKYILRLTQKEKSMDMILTYDSLVPNSFCVFKLDNDVYTSVYSLTLTGDSVHTILNVETLTHGKNIFLRSMFALSRPYFQQQQDSVFSKFKTVVEEKLRSR